MNYDPRNIERNKRIRKLTDRAKSAGHITPGEAFHLLGGDKRNNKQIHESRSRYRRGYLR